MNIYELVFYWIGVSFTVLVVIVLFLAVVVTIADHVISQIAHKKLALSAAKGELKLKNKLAP